MPTMIKDGTGSSSLVGVDSNRLEVSARTNDRIYYASREESKAFTAQLHLTQATSGASEGVGYLQYTGENSLSIKEIALSTECDYMTKFGIILNPTVANGIDRTPVNLRASSGIQSNTVCKDDGDGSTVSITGGNHLYTVRMNGPITKVIDFYDAVILEYGSIIGIKAAAYQDAVKIRANIMFSEAIV